MAKKSFKLSTLVFMVSTPAISESIQQTVPVNISISHYVVQEDGLTGVDIIDANHDFTALIADKGDAYAFGTQLQDFKQVSSYTGDYQLIFGDNKIFTNEITRPYVSSVKHDTDGYAPIYNDTLSGEMITISLGGINHNHFNVDTKLITDSLEGIKETKDVTSGITIQKPDVSHNELNNKTSVKKGQTVIQYHRKGSDLEVIEETFDE